MLSDQNEKCRAAKNAKDLVDVRAISLLVTPEFPLQKSDWNQLYRNYSEKLERDVSLNVETFSSRVDSTKYSNVCYTEYNEFPIFKAAPRPNK